MGQQLKLMLDRKERREVKRNERKTTERKKEGSKDRNGGSE